MLRVLNDSNSGLFLFALIIIELTLLAVVRLLAEVLPAASLLLAEVLVMRKF